jgi:hypothetical protein
VLPLGIGRRARRSSTARDQLRIDPRYRVCLYASLLDAVVLGSSGSQIAQRAGAPVCFVGNVDMSVPIGTLAAFTVVALLAGIAAAIMPPPVEPRNASRPSRALRVKAAPPGTP